MLPANNLDLFIYHLIPQTLFGIFIIGCVLSICGFAFTSTIALFKSCVVRFVHRSKFRSTLLFIMCAQLLALSQLAAIGIWAFSLVLIGIIPSWEVAMFFSASSYTTLGYFPATMPEGWHMIPAFIAFSGLFSFAWAASSTMAMIGILNTALDAKSHPPK